MPAATVLGVAAALISQVWPAAAHLAAWLAYWPAQWLVLVARYGADTPAGSLSWPAGAIGGVLLAAVLAAMVVSARHPVVRRVGAVVTVAVVVGTLPVKLVASGWPPPAGCTWSATSARATPPSSRPDPRRPSSSTPGRNRPPSTGACGGSASGGWRSCSSPISTPTMWAA